MRLMCRGEIHGATMTKVEVQGVSCLKMDELLMKQAQLKPFECVVISCPRNGLSLSTYVAAAPEGSGEIALCGIMAAKFQYGDSITIQMLSSCSDEELQELEYRRIMVNRDNAVLYWEQHRVTEPEDWTWQI